MKKIWGKLSAKENLCFRLLFAALLVVQLSMALYFGAQKVGYHIDEVYTYQLSSYEYFAYYGDIENYEQWYGSEHFLDALSAQGDELFNFSYVYQNQIGDTHPPLYYFVINIAMSLFPNVFSKWLGIVPNLILVLLTTLALYHASKRLTQHKWLALCIAAFYALSMGSMSSAVFIRMYAMMTLWTVLFLYFHARAVDEYLQGKIGLKTFVGLFVFTVCGILTQYYFLLVCFFACGVVCLYLLCKKAYKTLFQYAGTELAALILAYLFFPAMLSQLFFRGRGEQAVESLLGADGYFSSMCTILGLISNHLFAGFSVELLLVFVVMGLVLLLRQKGLLRIAQGKENAENALDETAQQAQAGWWAMSPATKRVAAVVGVLLTVAAGYIAVVVRIAPMYTDRYYMCVYPLIVICFVYGGYTLLVALLRNRKVATAVVAVCCAVITVVSYQLGTVGYLYTSQTQRNEILAEYQQTPVVVINCGYGNSILQYLYEFALFDEVFVCVYDNFESLQLANEDGKLDDGFLFYMIAYDFTEEERLWLLDYYLGFSSCVEIANDIYYCTK